MTSRAPVCRASAAAPGAASRRAALALLAVQDCRTAAQVQGLQPDPLTAASAVTRQAPAGWSWRRAGSRGRDHDDGGRCAPATAAVTYRTAPPPGPCSPAARPGTGPGPPSRNISGPPGGAASRPRPGDRPRARCLPPPRSQVAVAAPELTQPQARLAAAMPICPRQHRGHPPVDVTDIDGQRDHRMLIVQLPGIFRGHAGADQLDGRIGLRPGQILVTGTGPRLERRRSGNRCRPPATAPCRSRGAALMGRPLRHPAAGNRAASSRC